MELKKYAPNLSLDWFDEIDGDTWIVSDTHFGHDRIMVYEPCRLEAMQSQGYRNQNEWLIDNWNKTVGEDDLVIHLGDFAFRDVAVIERLNGRILMVLGNHDKSSLTKFHKYRKQSPEKLRVIFSQVETAEGAIRSKNQMVSGFIKVLGGKKVMFSHYPVLCEDSYATGKVIETRAELLNIFKNEKCDICVHGHVHSKDTLTHKTKEINVSIERTGFKPIRLKEVLNL